MFWLFLCEVYFFVYIGPAVCTPQVQFAKVGTDVTFTCNATNVPSKSFTWDNPKQTASSDSQYSNTSVTGSSQVTIKSISASDFGYHVCNATVNPDQPNSCKVFLQLPKGKCEIIQCYSMHVLQLRLCRVYVSHAIEVYRSHFRVKIEQFRCTITALSGSVILFCTL